MCEEDKKLLEEVKATQEALKHRWDPKPIGDGKFFIKYVEDESGALHAQVVRAEEVNGIH